jgi:hypothetical protein
MFVTVELVREFIIYVYIKYQVPCSNDLLVITVKAKPKCRFYAAAILLYILQKHYLNI